ncbi:MAG: cytochrome P460 family protein [Sphingomicrobium sp.]
MSRIRVKAGTEITGADGVHFGIVPPAFRSRREATAPGLAAKAVSIPEARMRQWAPMIAAAALAMAGSGCGRSIKKSESGRSAAQTTSGRSAVQAASSGGRYLPEYLPDGQLVLPKNWRSWVFVGAPLTPNALNNGKASFPEFHNVYIEPGSYAIYKRTGVFPEGTILFKELQLTLPPFEFPDGSRIEPSGRGYFGGKFNGADVGVKDTKRYADTGGWGYYNFHHYEPKAASATLRPKEECASCHMSNAKKDDVWTQFYPLLDDVSIK